MDNEQGLNKGLATLFAVGFVRRLVWKGTRRPDG
jgi:hypothetical protein